MCAQAPRAESTQPAPTPPVRTQIIFRIVEAAGSSGGVDIDTGLLTIFKVLKVPKLLRLGRLLKFLERFEGAANIGRSDCDSNREGEFDRGAVPQHQTQPRPRAQLAVAGASWCSWCS